MEQNRMNEFIQSVLVNSTQMAFVEEADRTLKLLENISEIFRYFNSNLQFVTLFNELEILNRYIEIQKVRYGERYNFNIINENAYKSLYITHLSVIDFLDGILYKHIEQKGIPINFAFEFENNGEKICMKVQIYSSNYQDYFCKDLI